MATGPINYGAMMADPFDGLGQYLQMGQQIQQIRAQRAQAENAQLAAQQYQADVGAAFAAPTPQAFAALAVKYPQHREAFKQGWDGLNAERQQSELGDVSTLAAALQSGRADLAMQKLDARIKTMGEAGADTSKYELLKGEIERDPQKAYGTALYVLGGIPGGDKVLENLGKIGTERRAESLFPDEQRAKKAGATEAEAKAITATAEAGVAGEKAKLGIDALKQDIEWKKQDSRIKAMQASLAREGNDLKRQELKMKLDEVVQARDQKGRDLQADVDNKLTSLQGNLEILKDIDDLGGVGLLTGANRNLPFTDSRTVAAKIDQLKSQLTLENTKFLKGAMSDSDIKLLSQAATSLDLLQSPSEVRKELARIKAALERGQKQIRKQYGVKDAGPDQDAKPRGPVVVDY